ncbi:FAD-dependent oxidoreductase [Hymenobacter lutimineralis]|uniref:FAD-dependent oxidoreductase n=1 Tax=Hymenobacter lutimineralis TaxID=2606448 RepID=A0A5D6VI25_9BACT|nr:FAD-dependent oxidoreductase [Hymenobacter lutimineralis]TYZ14378.1 FAD-dependent oxidoreductase [Hymenobacter lutimineralis]
MQLPGLIIGGGIAGLTTALALQRRGLPVTVCESAPEIKPLGAGIWMAPNAMQVFHRLGITDKINAAGVPLRNIQVVDARMQPIMRTDQEKIRRRFGYTTTAIRRARLQEILLAELAPGTVQLAKTVAHFTQSTTGVTVDFTDGTTLRAGYLIGADGIHSVVRGQLFPGARFGRTGHVVWRGISAVQLRPEFKQAIMEVWANGVRFGFSEIADGLVDWFVGEYAPNPVAYPEGLKTHLLRLFEGFAYPVGAILAAADEPRIIRNDITDFDPIPSWSQGLVCLIGDAAHASTPYMGQGGCQAVEDAYALAQCLDQEATAEQAFAAMQRLRRAKAQYIVRTSRIMGKVGYWQHASAAVRNFVIRATPQLIIDEQFRRVYSLNF